MTSALEGIQHTINMILIYKISTTDDGKTTMTPRRYLAGRNICKLAIKTDLWPINVTD